ncbi:MAG: ABC transporter substrate-binding protein [Alphaproteobacteria bacterium]|nr:ABC transporter substrate-binding protein [Alphaproteobacteria bacterium]
MSETKREVRAGFIPLVDCAPLVIAAEHGFAEAEGLDLKLSRETSWATIRDKLAVSHFDAAHILAPMPIAANLGLGPLPTPMLVPMALGTGANTVTVSNALWQELIRHLDRIDFSAAPAVTALASVVRDRGRQGAPPLQLGIVHPHSAHHYELAYWLSSGGIVAGQDVELVVVPPSLMPAALANAHIDGFCAGEPWGTVASSERVGVILTTNAHIWRNSPEKVLGLRLDWAQRDPQGVEALVRAVYSAAVWCDQPGNQDELAAILAREAYLGQSVDVIRPCLARRLRAGDGALHPIDGFLNFASNTATFPWISHALWFYTQMVRLGQTLHSEAALHAARSTYRPDIYRSALQPLDVELPSVNTKVEGALHGKAPAGSTRGNLSLGPDAFFDGKVFDPDRLEDYLASLPDTSS